LGLGKGTKFIGRKLELALTEALEAEVDKDHHAEETTPLIIRDLAFEVLAYLGGDKIEVVIFFLCEVGVQIFVAVKAKRLGVARIGTGYQKAG
jgi:16S rRNA U1498 N3-methylase RsmE